MGTVNRKPALYRICGALPLLLLCVILLVYGDIAAAGVNKGLLLCIETLFPALFPYLILSEFMVVRRLGDLLKGAISRPVSWLFGISGQGSTALLMGFLCGAPVGTVTATALYRQGEISRPELHRLTLFINNPGAGFLIGAVGGTMLGNTAAGVALFAITWIAAAMIGIALRLVMGDTPQAQSASSASEPPPLSTSDLTGSITRAFSALLRIFAFVIFFSCISSCLLAATEKSSLPDACNVLLCGLLELTAGVGEAVARLSPEAAFCTVAFLSGFSGLSICLQIFSVAEEEGLPILPYLLARSVQGCLAYLLARLYLFAFAPTLHPTDCLATFAQNHIGQRLLLGVSLLLFFLFLAGAIRKKGGGKSHRPLK